MKEPKTHQLAFTLAISILELPRSPAANKFLEVKLYYLVRFFIFIILGLLIWRYEIFHSLIECYIWLVIKVKVPVILILENIIYGNLVKETELVSLLRKIEIGASELQIIRDRARKFVENAILLASAPQPYVLPISLGHYILDSLSFSYNSCQG